MNKYENKRSITIEYVLIDGVNDSPELARKLTKLLSDEDRGFITGEERRILLDRGVKESLVNLITKESLKDLTQKNLLEVHKFPQ